MSDDKVNIFSKVESLRKESYKKSNTLLIVSLCLIIIGIVLFFLGAFIAIFELSIVAFILGFAGAIILAVRFNKVKKLLNQIKPLLVNTYLEENGFENFTYSPKGSIGYREFKANHLINNSPDIEEYEDLITGEYKHVNFAMGDMCLSEIIYTVDSKGRSHRQIVNYFRGKALILDYPETIDAEAYIYEKGAHYAPKIGEKVQTEVTEFNNKFSISSPCKETIYKILTPSMIQKIISLNNIQRGILSLAFTKDKLLILVDNNPGSLNIKINKPITEESVIKDLQDILLPAMIINEFRLDSTIYVSSELKYNENVA